MAKEAGTEGGDEKMASADEESGSDEDEEVTLKRSTICE